MERESLSPSEFRRGRETLFKFTFFNVLSFLLISSNIIILYALKLGASSFFIGMLSSFLQISYLFMLAGRFLIKRMGAVRLMGTFWLLRYLVMLPIFVTPLLYHRGYAFHALFILAIVVFGFNVSRGIAITSWNPIMGELAGKKDRGSFLAKIQLITHLVTILASIGIAFFIGKDAPPERFTLFIGIGILSGFIACHYISRLPEPVESSRGIGERFTRSIVESLKDKSFLKFIVFFFTSSLSLAMLTPFVIVFFKNVYGNTDSDIIIFTIAGGFGALSMALINGFMIDRVGSKPFILMYSVLTAAVTIPLIIAPSYTNREFQLIFAALIFFFVSMGNNGLFNTSQVYFYSFIKPEERLNLGIIYFLAMGVSGTIGSILGGSILEVLQTHIEGPAGTLEGAFPFQMYFAIILVLFVINSLIILSLKDTGLYTVRDALSIIFSPRDLRAIGLLNRLDKSKSIAEERSIIHALGNSGSVVTREELLSRLKSPSFVIRTEALTALHGIPIDGRIEKVLISEVKNHQFTTGYIAAELIGEKRIFSAIKPLRLAMFSNDYFLAGKAMVALAKLEDRESIGDIISIIEKTTNPRLIIHGAWALQIFRHRESIPVLVKKMERKTAPFLRDEIILSIAGILDIFDKFYPYYTRFLESAHEGIGLLEDLVREKLSSEKGEEKTDRDSSLTKLLELLEHLRRGSGAFSAGVISLFDELVKSNSSLNFLRFFYGGLKNDSIARLERFRFLIAFICIELPSKSSIY